MAHDHVRMSMSSVETPDGLIELQQLRSQLPNSPGQDNTVTENRLLILRIDDDLVKLRTNLDSYWWTRRWALSAVENGIKLLKSATKNNEDLMKDDSLIYQKAVDKERVRVQREAAAANVALLSVLLSVTEARLAQMEQQIDVAISKNQSKTGQEDRELQLVKSRLSASQTQAREAASSARLCLKHFGFLVTWVNYMHSTPITRSLMPLATSIIGCNMIYEHGDAMMRFGGKATEASRKYIEDADIMGRLKTWNPFTGPEQHEKQQQDDKREPSTSPSPPRSGPLPTATSLSTPAMYRWSEKPPAYEDAITPWLPVANTVPRAPASRLDYSSMDKSPEDEFGAFHTAQPPAQLLQLQPIQRRKDITVTSTVNVGELIDLGVNDKRNTVDLRRVDREVQLLQHKSDGIQVRPIDSEAALLDLGPEDNPWT